MKLASDFVPTLIVVLVLVALAFWIVHESDKNNKEVIDAVRQAQAERQKAIEEAIKKELKDPQAWQKSQDQMKALSTLQSD